MAERDINCGACGNAEAGRTLNVREMMFGTREQFRYRQCPSCGCLQLMDVPSDLTRYYPPDYYSFGKRELAAPRDGIYGWLARQRNETVLRFKPIGAALSRIKPIDGVWHANLDNFLHFSALREFGITFNSRVLDVGCGSGSLLQNMALFGFRSLAGCDPFLEHDLAYTGVRVFKGELRQMEDCFDLIMLHHAFEHMADPGEVLREIRGLLSPEGLCLVRIPVADSAAFERYQENWVQLTPRVTYSCTPVRVLRGWLLLQV